jgi:hypothetical protein
MLPSHPADAIAFLGFGSLMIALLTAAFWKAR